MALPNRLAALALLATSVPALSGCGPAMSTYLILRAQTELDGAKAAEAEKYAVYEYTAASAYLQKAREEQGYADFGPSIDFAYKAGELAKAGREKSVKEKRVVEEPAALPIEEAEEAASSAPKVIIKKSSDDEETPPATQSPVKVKVVPVNPEEAPTTP